MVEGILVFFAGAVGALVRQLVEGNKVVLPCRVTGGFALGFLGSMLVGGFVGWLVDGSVPAAAMAGYVGTDALERFGLPVTTKSVNRAEDCNQKEVI